MTEAEIRHRFCRKTVSPSVGIELGHVQERFVELVIYLDESLPDGRNKALVLTKLHEAKFFSSEALAKDTKEE